VNADLDRAEFALDRGYGGRGFVPEPSWRAMQSALAALRGKRTTVDTLCDRIADALWELPDAHLSAWLRLENNKVRAKCGALFKTAERAPGVGPSLAAEEPRPWGFEAVTVGHATFGVVTLKSFPFHDDPVWQGFEQALAELPQTDGLVIDLRGNDGGDDARGFDLARALFDAPAPPAAARVHERRTPETLTLLLNTFDAFGRKEDGSLLPFLVQRYEETARDRDAAARAPGPEWRVQEIAKAPVAPGPKAYQGAIAVLVDAACKSSCESTLEALRLHPKAKVFGERTGGFVHFGDVGRVVLPHSGIELAIPTKYDEYAGGKLYDKIGFEPDVPVQGGADAFDVAMAWALPTTPKSRIEKAADYVVPEAAREAEKKRLEALGLSLPSGSPVLEKPFAEPLSRRSYVVPQSWFFRRPPHRVFPPALLADLDVLEQAMTRAYGGWQTAEKHGWDWRRMFDGWRVRLRLAGTRWMPLKTAFDEIKRFEQAQLDNHTTIPLSVRFGGGSRTWVLDEKPSAPCTATRDKDGKELPISKTDPAEAVKEARLFDGKDLAPAAYIVRPENRSDLTAVQCGGAWISVRPPAQLALPALKAAFADLAGHPEDKPFRRRLTDEVVYLRLPTFTKVNSEILDRERGAWEKPNGHEKTLLVDLRHNDGGDAAFDALEGYYSMKDLKDYLPFTKRTSASCLYHALRWGYTTISSQGLTPPLTEGMKKELQWGIDDLWKKDDPACPAKQEETRGKRSYRDKAHASAPEKGKPRIVVLVDGGCGSDCEYMTATLQKLPGTLVAGVNTFGVMQYIQPGFSVLPNTRLPYRIALGTSDTYGDGRSADGYGLDVDVLIDAEEGWKKEGLLRLVEKLGAAK
jgi:C-terminal processing protease CtpA/Prc